MLRHGFAGEPRAALLAGTRRFARFKPLRDALRAFGRQRARELAVAISARRRAVAAAPHPPPPGEAPDVPPPVAAAEEDADAAAARFVFEDWLPRVCHAATRRGMRAALEVGAASPPSATGTTIVEWRLSRRALCALWANALLLNVRADGAAGALELAAAG